MKPRKLLLDPSTLQVESFAPNEGLDGRGTVMGHNTLASCPFYMCEANNSLENNPSCFDTCQGPTPCADCQSYGCPAPTQAYTCPCPAQTSPAATCPDM